MWTLPISVATSKMFWFILCSLKVSFLILLLVASGTVIVDLLSELSIYLIMKMWLIVIILIIKCWWLKRSSKMIDVTKNTVLKKIKVIHYFIKMSKIINLQIRLDLSFLFGNFNWRIFRCSMCSTPHIYLSLKISPFP